MSGEGVQREAMGAGRALQDVVITGIGLISSLGEGVEPHLAALKGGSAPVLDQERFAPYSVHPMAALELDRQIPKKSDQRQMEPWQRLGVYAAGLALDSAGIKDDAGAKSRLECIVAAGGGERDHAVDGQVLTGLRHANDPGAFLNERLMGDLRPTLFLAQLSNLLAGNIAIVHGITGASRTFMGEEQCGVDAIRTAAARIAHGQCAAMLVGGAFNAERRDMLLLMEAGGMLAKGPFTPVLSRSGDSAGMILGSMAAFLHLETRESAQARGATIHARIAHVAADQCRRSAAGQVSASLGGVLSTVMQPGGSVSRLIATSSGAGALGEERAAFAAVLPDAAPLAIGDLVGHGLEAAFPVGVALAAASIAAGLDTDVVVAGAGHHRGEGASRLVSSEGASRGAGSEGASRPGRG
jgi:3-oxoacyl-[acyl-carrier-protein] synthase II